MSRRRCRATPPAQHEGALDVEQVASAAERADVVRRALDHLLPRAS